MVKSNIYLIGFMGAGKSSVGKILAEKLKRDFYETDLLIEESEGKSISEIFNSDGESYFRDREEEVVKKIAREIKSAVVALGGGAILRLSNWELIFHSGVTVYLKWDRSVLLDRIIDDDSRPLVSTLDRSSRRRELLNLFALRKPLYEQADLIINCSLDMNEIKTAEQILNLVKDRND